MSLTFQNNLKVNIFLISAHYERKQHLKMLFKITMSKISIMISFHLSVLIVDHLRLSVNKSNAVLMCIIGVKYQYTIQVVCAYAHFLGNDHGMSLL